MPGVPGVYFHSLIGSSNDHDGVKRTGVFRSINREKFNIGWIDKIINEEGSRAHLVFKSYKSMLSLRTNQKAFSPFGTFEILDLHEKIFAILRHGPLNKNHILALNNCSNTEVVVKVPKLFQDSKELLSGEEFKGEEITLEGYQICWLKQIS